MGRIGVSRAELLRAYVGNSVRVETAPISGPAEVVFHNDELTRYEVVVAVLQDHFGKSSEEARDLTRRVHENGLWAFPVGDAAAAKLAVDAALADCAELGMPLRIELRAIPVGGKGSDRPPSF